MPVPRNDRMGWATALLVVLGLGCGDDDVDADADAAAAFDAGRDAAVDAAADARIPRVCPGEGGSDLIRAETLLDSLTGALAVASDGATAVVCGRDFVQAVGLSGPVAGAPVALADPCRGVAVDGARAVVTTAAGQIVLLAIAAEAGLTPSAQTTLPERLGGVALVDDTLWVAAGVAGLVRFDVSAEALTPLSSFLSVADARDVVAAGPGRLAVADGVAGAALVDAATGDEVARLAPPTYDQILVDPDAPGGVRDVILPFEATTIAVDGDWILVGCDAFGTFRATRSGDALGEPHRSPAPFGRPPGVEGIVRDVALDGDELWYADGSSVVRLALSGDAELTWIAREPRPGFGTLGGSFWTGLSAAAGEMLALSGSALVRLLREPARPAPTIDLGRTSVTVRAEPGGEPGDVLLQIGNLGDDELAVRIAGAEPAQFGASILGLAGQPGADPDDPLCLRVPPGPSVGALQVQYSAADAAPLSGTLLLQTNDPDRPEIRLPVRGNPIGLAVGDPAPAFELPTLDGSWLRSSELDGEVVLLKFFNFQ